MEEKLWCLWDWRQATDFLLCNGDSDLLPKLYKKDEIRYTYNQYLNKRSYVSCTVFAAVGMASDQTNYQFSYDEIKEIDDSSYDNPEFVHIRHRWEWAYVSDMVNHVRKWWNKNEKLVKKYWKLASYCISKYDDEIIEDVINNLYTIDWAVNLNTKYNEDKNDWMLDWTDFWKWTIWHSVDVICKEWQRSVKDSGSMPYYWLKHKLSEISSFWTYFYLYTLVNENAYEEIKRLNEFKTSLLVAIEQNSKLRHLTNDENYQAILHYMNEKNRAKIKDVDEQLKQYV